MNVLDGIIAYKREEVAARKKASPAEVLEAAIRKQTQPRGFERALRERGDRLALIAEIKKASPSKGLIRFDFEPAALARAYASAGAACLSVLTDAPSFQGHEDYLVQARKSCDLPVLRKDFMIDEWQISESRSIGADAILIILAAIDDELASDLADVAAAYFMDALVEVHDRRELDRALRMGFKLIGINNRSLATFETDLAITEQLAADIPRDVTLVSESGIYTHDDMLRLRRAGARGFLVGESLMRQDDVETATRALLGR